MTSNPGAETKEAAPAAGAARWWTILLCWTTVAIEGFDVVVLGAIIPRLIQSQHLGITTSDATTIVTASLVGITVGAAGVGPLADRFGRRVVLIGSVVLMSAVTLLVPLSTSVAMFAALRFVTGVGIGACMPVSLTVVAEQLSVKHRGRASTMTMTGFHAGAVLASLLALWAKNDWEVLFYGLGALGLAVAAVQWFKLEESPDFQRARDQQVETSASGSYRSLLEPRFRRAIIGTWVASFMGLLLVYGLNSWLPQLMQAAGYPIPAAVTHLLVLNAGGIAGLLIGGYVADRTDLRATAMVWFAVAAVTLCVLSIKFSSTTLLNVVVFLTGVFVFSAQVLVYAYITERFPTDVRGTALGSASAVGRIGSIVGPYITGALLTAGIGHPWGFYFFSGVAVLGVLAVAALPGRQATTTT